MFWILPTYFTINTQTLKSNHISNIPSRTIQTQTFNPYQQKMKGAAVSMIMMVAIMLMMKTASAITCGQVDSALMPCVPYLTTGGNPASSCCAGVSSLKSMVSTTADRRVACNCAKEAANRYHNLKEDAATSLPSKCGVEISVPISRTVDCNAIS